MEVVKRLCEFMTHTGVDYFYLSVIILSHADALFFLCIHV